MNFAIFQHFLSISLRLPAPARRPTAKFSYPVRGGGQVEYDGEVKAGGSTVPYGRGVELSPDGSVWPTRLLCIAVAT